MARYNPMQSVVGQAGLQLSGQGLAWEGKERGLGRRAIQDYLNNQARKATKAGRGIGLSNTLGKGLGMLAMLATGPGGLAGKAGWSILKQVLLGAGVSGGVSGLGGKHFADKLIKSGAPDVLYGVAEAEEAESYAHQAIDTLIGSVVPKALSTAITTPLDYLTLKNTFTPRPEKVTEASSYAAGDIGKLFAAGQEGYKQKGFQDLLSLIGRGAKSGGDIPSVTLGTDISNYYNNPYLRL
jgi:hypothetical protein